MSCASCHSPQYAYGPPNSLSVQLGSDPTQAGTRAVPSLRYKDATPPYADHAANPDGVTLAAAGGGFMWDGRAATLADQAVLPLLNPLEMNAASKAAVVRGGAERRAMPPCSSRPSAPTCSPTPTPPSPTWARRSRPTRREDISFHPYTSKYDLYVHNKLGGTLTAAEERGLRIFNGSDIANCSACHYAGVNFDGNQGLMTDFTYQALGAPRNDSSIPGQPRSDPGQRCRCQPTSTWACAARCAPTTRRRDRHARSVLRQVQGARRCATRPRAASSSTTACSTR